MRKAIVILGAPGSGKSTIGRSLADQLGYHYVSTGDLARRLIEQGMDDTWQLIGDFAPEDQIRQAFADDIKDHQAVVVDGMPRKVDQVTVLEGHFDEITCINLVAEMDTLVERLMSRGRVDDQEKVIKLRVRKYNRQITQILEKIKDKVTRGDHYKSLQSVGVDGRTPEQIIDIIIGRMDD
mgnify:FL=1